MHENRLHTMDARLRASLEARRAGSFFQWCSPIRRGGVPSGVAAFIAIIKAELSRNIRFSQEILNNKLNTQQGFTIATKVSPP
jgi:hypothetical protein